MGKDNIKVCLYLEFYHFLGGILFKEIGTGLLSSYKNQKKVLERTGIQYIEKWDDSCNILQINTPWLYSLYIIKKARKQNKKIIIWSHVTAEDIQGVFRMSFFLSKLARKYLKYAYNLADVILAPSEYTKSLLVAYGISGDKIIAQSNGVDVEQFSINYEKRNEVRTKYNLNDIVIGTVALAIPRKGINSFVEMAKNFKNYNFVWFGKIYSSFMVQALPKKLPQNLQFTGYTQDIIGSFSALDIFFFPSYEENQGMVLLEAGSIGLPIIVRDIPVYSGWLHDGENCLKAKNDNEFREKISMLIENPELRKRLAESMRQSVINEHSVDAVGKKMVNLYEQLLK